MKKPKCIVMCGLPYSGKSTQAKKFAKEYNAVIFATDKLRAEMFGDVTHQSDNTETYKELHKRIKDFLSFGRNIIYDATCLSSKKRRRFLQELKHIPCEKICVLMATPYKECIKLKENRKREIPESVIKEMYTKFETPWYNEGWDKIKIIYSENSKNSFGTPEDWIASVEDFDQDNPYHKLTLGKHSLMTTQLVLKETDSVELKYAAMLHDEGKVFTKTYTDYKGDTIDVACYRQHQCVSAYDSLFFEYPAAHLYTSVLIGWHMQPHFNKLEKTKEKYFSIWGEDLYRDIMLLHNANKQAHQEVC